MFRNNPQLLVLLVFFALSGISWAANKAREQKQIKDAREAQRRRREEELRTGRETDASQVTSGGGMPSLEELAAKRQKQLEELRARQQARAREGGRPGPVAKPLPGSTTVRQIPPSVPSPPRPVRPSTPPTVPMPRPTGVPARGAKPPRQIGSPTPVPARGRGARQQKPIVIGNPPVQPPPRPTLPVRRREDQKPARRVLETAPEISEQYTGESTTKGLLANLRSGTTRDGAHGTGETGGGSGGMFSRESLKRAIIMNEVLSPPVSMREGF